MVLLLLYKLLMFNELQYTHKAFNINNLVYAQLRVLTTAIAYNINLEFAQALVPYSRRLAVGRVGLVSVGPYCYLNGATLSKAWCKSSVIL